MCSVSSVVNTHRERRPKSAARRFDECLVARACDEDAVRQALGRAVHAGRADRGCDGRGGPAAVGGHRRDPDASRRERHDPRRSRGRDAPLPGGARSRRARRVSMPTSRSSRRSSAWISISELCHRQRAASGGSCRRAAAALLWIDMENARYVDATLDLFRHMRRRSPFVGVALQAYLYRTERDLESLLPLGAALRLVKGAYLEPADVAYPEENGGRPELLPARHPHPGRAPSAGRAPAHCDPRCRAHRSIDGAHRRGEDSADGVRIRDALRDPGAAAAPPDRGGSARCGC